jgi:sugar-specific transcriptional regulator TrmB
MAHQTTTGKREETLAQGLRNLGLTEYEIRVYMAILRHPGSRIPEVAKTSGVPQAKVYATVKRLRERSLLESHLGPVNTYSALSPDDAFMPLVEDLRKRASDAASVVDLLQEEHQKPSPAMGAREGRIKLFQGRQAIMRNFREMVAGSQESITLVARVPLMIQDDDDVLEEALKRRVEVRILAQSPPGYDFTQHEVFQRQLKLGCQARSLAEVPMRMGVFDRRIAIIVLHEAGAGLQELMMLEVRNAGLSEGLLKVFEPLWAVAEPMVV